MALDRIVTLHLYAEGTRDQSGEYVPGPVTDVPGVWAEISTTGSVDNFDASGAVIVQQRIDAVIRYRQDVIDTGPARLELTALGDRYNVEQVDPFSLARGRYVRLSAQAVLDE